MSNTVLITGCSTGLGKAAAFHFARKGWNVIATMRRPEVRNDFAALPNVVVERLDVEDPETISTAVEAGIRRFGAVDTLINNAGFGLFGIFEALPVGKIREQFDVNVFGVMAATRAMLPHFRANGRGMILNVSSGAGVFGLPMLSLYCASKFALEGFSEALWYELASQNIGVKIIEPGGVVSTEFSRRTADEAAQTSPPASYDEFATQTGEVFRRLRASRAATEQDVADVLYTAATDGSKQLRYVATADIEPLVRYRRETSEGEYIAYMRSYYGL